MITGVALHQTTQRMRELNEKKEKEYVVGVISRAAQTAALLGDDYVDININCSEATVNHVVNWLKNIQVAVKASPPNSRTCAWRFELQW